MIPSHVSAGWVCAQLDIMWRARKARADFINSFDVVEQLMFVSRNRAGESSIRGSHTFTLSSLILKQSLYMFSRLICEATNGCATSVNRCVIQMTKQQA